MIALAVIGFAGFAQAQTSAPTQPAPPTIEQQAACRAQADRVLQDALKADAQTDASLGVKDGVLKITGTATSVAAK